MKTSWLTSLLMVTVFALVVTVFAQWQPQASNTTASFRGLSAVNDQVVWASGTKGTFVRTTDGGKTWTTGVIAGAEQLDLRDIEAFNAETAYALSIGKGADSRIYKTTDGGRTWKLQFQNAEPEAFFDGLAFWDERHGIAMSDPVAGRFLILTTDDAGATWQPQTNLPPALPGEGGFAASGTSIFTQGRSNVWFVTGGASVARVFRSTDRGRSWHVAATPIRAGAASAGIFSVAFRDARHGVIVGGDYQKSNEAADNIAFSDDGGRTWRAPSRAEARPSGFRSCVIYTQVERQRAVLAVGSSGSDLSSNDGRTWRKLDAANYNVVSGARYMIWAAGPQGRLARLAGK